MSENPKTVVLTGASRGIGHATVKRFSHEGWRIITCSRDEIPDACQRDPNWAIHIPTDLADENSLKAFIEQANDVIGDAPLNALVNNAAVSPKTPFKERLGCLNGDIDGWRQVYDLNLFAPIMLCRGFAAAAVRRQRPRRCRRKHHFDRRTRDPSLRRIGVFNFEVRLVRPHTGTGRRIRRTRCSGECGRTRRD